MKKELLFIIMLLLSFNSKVVADNTKAGSATTPAPLLPNLDAGATANAPGLNTEEPNKKKAAATPRPSPTDTTTSTAPVPPPTNENNNPATPAPTNSSSGSSGGGRSSGSSSSGGNSSSSPSSLTSGHLSTDNLTNLPDLPNVADIPVPQSVEVIDITDQGSPSSSTGLKGNASSTGGGGSGSGTGSSSGGGGSKGQIDNKFKLSQDKEKPKNNKNSLPFPTDHLIDIPPIHKKDKQNKDILSKTSQDKPKKKTKLDKNNEDQNKEISKEQNEIKSKELEKVFNLDFKTAPGELEIYNNKTPGNKHLPNLVHVDEYKYATFLAIDNGDIETFEDYAKRIGNLEYIDEEDNTLLIYAAMNDQPEIVEWLIKNKSALNAKNIYGATALHAAVINNNAKIVKALINAGASTKIVDQNGKTAKDYAISSDVQNLLDHNAVHKHNKIKSHNEKKTAPSSADSPKENELSSSIPKTNEVDMMMQGSQQKESQHTEKKKAAKKVKKTRQEKAESLH